MSYRKLIGFIVVLALLMGISVVGAQDDALRTAALPDLGSISYPIESYSLRPGELSIPAEQASAVMFPGAYSIVPNDSFVAEQQAQDQIAYAVHVAPVIAPEGVTAETLWTLLGKLALAQYEGVDAANISVFELNGLPAVRVDRVPTPLVEIASHVLVLNGSVVIEMVVLPARIYGAPAHNDFMTGDADANPGISEAIIQSFIAAA